MQTAIPCLFMRGGTSRGPFFLESDLPEDPALRDRVLLAAMGSPDARQIDGLGGADPLTSKVGIVARVGAARRGPRLPVRAGADRRGARRHHAQLRQHAGGRGAVRARARAHPGARRRDHRADPDAQHRHALRRHRCRRPDGRITYEGSARIDGVPGTSAPIRISFLDTAGSVCGTLLPTGHVVDTFDGVPVTCIDNGMPVVVIRAADLGRTGYETRDALNADAELKARIESIRRQAGPAMNLGDVTKKVVPKMSLIAPPRAGGSLCSRTFIPHDCHSAVGVLGAVTLATAARAAGLGGRRRRRAAAGPPQGGVGRAPDRRVHRRARARPRSTRRTCSGPRCCARRGSSCAAKC